jgi:hypothetical protein
LNVLIGLHKRLGVEHPGIRLWVGLRRCRLLIQYLSSKAVSGQAS